MRIGKVVINKVYYVDLDNADMISEAQDAIYEDVMNLVKYNEVMDAIDVEHLTPEEQGRITEADIPSWLKGEEG